MYSLTKFSRKSYLCCGHYIMEAQYQHLALYTSTISPVPSISYKTEYWWYIATKLHTVNILPFYFIVIVLGDGGLPWWAPWQDHVDHHHQVRSVYQMEFDKTKWFCWWNSAINCAQNSATEPVLLPVLKWPLFNYFQSGLSQIYQRSSLIVPLLDPLTYSISVLSIVYYFRSKWCEW